MTTDTVHDRRRHPDSAPMDPPWPAECVVTDPVAVQSLLDLKAVRALGPFLRGPRTLTQAATELGIRPSSLAYWIAKLERVGLLTRLPSAARAGMSMPRFRAAGQCLYLPFAAVPPGMSSDLLDGGRRKLLDKFLDGLDETLRTTAPAGLQFTPSGPIGVEIDIRGRDAHGPERWTDFWGTLKLRPDAAERFAAELKDLVERYRDEEAGRTEYVVHAGIAPVARFKYRSA